MQCRNKDFWLELQNKYKTARQAASETGIPYPTIMYNFKKFDITPSPKAERLRRNRLISQIELEAKYLETGSARLTGEFFEITQMQVLKRLPQAMRAINECSRYMCDEGFFNQDTEYSFYLAGLLAADGCLKLKDGKYKQISFDLKREDRATVETMKTLLHFDGPIFDFISKSTNPKWKDCSKSGITISSDKVFDSLVSRFSLGCRKSLTLRFPERLIDHPLVHHFLRGYWDGDGTIYFDSPKNNKIPTAFCGLRGTPPFLMVVRKILEANTSVRPRGSKPIRTNTGQGILEYGGNRVVASIRDFIYKDATIFMERKHSLFFSQYVGANLRPPHTFGQRVKRSAPIEATNVLTGKRIVFLNIEELADSKIFSKWCVQDCFTGKQATHRGHTFSKLPKGSFPGSLEAIVYLPPLEKVA